MAARSPRRSFAAPFVVTLAAAPACYTQTAPPPQGPGPGPGPAEPAQPAQPAQTPEPPVVVNPPRPQPEPTPPPAPAGQRWTVYKAKDGCMAAVKVECPVGATCNPPPPFAYACPANVTIEPSKSVTVVSSSDGACYVQYDPPACPPGTACNPPRPTPVPCPTR